MYIYFLGFTTDGEWNSYRTRGNTRPLSIFQICVDVRAKYSCINLNKMIKMITPILCMLIVSMTLCTLQNFLYTVGKDGSITGAMSNLAISLELLGNGMQVLLLTM